MSTFLMPVLEMAAPTLEWRALAPVLLVFAAACVGILLEAVLPRAYRFLAQMTLVFATVVVSIAFLVINWRGQYGGSMAMGSLMLDGPTYFMWGALLVFGTLAFMVFSERQLNGGVTAFAASAASVPGSLEESDATAARYEHTEVFPLGLFALGGMMVFLASADLIVMFVALEVFSLPLYLLSGMARRRRLLSQEAALKYFLLGAFSSGFFLFGIAMLYVFSGSLDLRGIHEAIAANAGSNGLVLVGLAFLAIGLLFKVGVVPFHSWTPDVYMGAPTPVTGFMAATTKIAAFGAMVRVVYVVGPSLQWDLEPMLWTVAILTMVVGTVVALVQTDVKRMLAYSSIAHAGFVLVGVLAFSTEGIASVLFYLVVYGLATIGAFAVVTLVRQTRTGAEGTVILGEATHLAQWAGLGRRSPWLAGALSLFLLSFAGIPLTAGFAGKFTVFTAAADGGAVPLVVVGVIASAAAVFFYVRLIVLMYFTPEREEEGEEGVTVVTSSGFTTVVIAVAAIGTILLGVLPGPLLELLGQAVKFLP